MRLHFTNFGYWSDSSFATLDLAIISARSCGFECSIHDAHGIVASWSPLNGTTHYRPSA